MKKKIVLSILVVSIVALLVGGAASAFYTAESETICVTAKSLEIGVALWGGPHDFGCIYPGWCDQIWDTYKLEVTCDDEAYCREGLQLYAKPVIDRFAPDGTLGDNVLVRVWFDKQGQAVYQDWTPLSSLKEALDMHEPWVFSCCAGELNKELKICFQFYYPDCGDQTGDMGKTLGFCYKVQAQTVPAQCCIPGIPVCPCLD